MQHKLVSPQDTLLGTVTIPDQWSELLFNKYPYYTAQCLPRASFVPWPPTEDYGALPNEVVIIRVTLARSYSEYRDSLMLVEGTIEDLEKVEGCSFSPSMGYLRSQIEAANI